MREKKGCIEQGTPPLQPGTGFAFCVSSVSRKEHTMEHSSSLPTRRLARRRGDYGFDTPYVPLLLGLVGVIFLALGLLSLWILRISVLGVICLVYAVFFLLSVVRYLYTTRWGKFRAWANILTLLRLRGDEQLLDLGCGRGAVLLMAAAYLPDGKVAGVDLWKSSDQSGNVRSVAERNAELEGVAGRVELHTADMQKLPLADDTFDVVLSSLRSTISRMRQDVSRRSKRSCASSNQVGGS
jgi:arsenite methyltransferase